MRKRAAIFLGSGSGTGGKKRKSVRCKEKGWEEIGNKVEVKIKRELRKWADKLAIQTKRLQNR